MRLFTAEPIHALNQRIRGIIHVLNRSNSHHSRSGSRRRGMSSSDSDSGDDDGNETKKLNDHKSDASSKQIPLLSRRRNHTNGGDGATGESSKILFVARSGSDSELATSKAKLKELKEQLKCSRDEVIDLKTKNQSLLDENNQMKVDMNRAVVELEQLLEQLSELKSQVNHLKKENNALACEKMELIELESNNHHEYKQHASEGEDEEGRGSREEQIRKAYSDLEDEADSISSSLADALQKYKIGNNGNADGNTNPSARQQSAGDYTSSDHNNNNSTTKRKSGGVGTGFGLFGGLRNRGGVTGQGTDEAYRPSPQDDNLEPSQNAATKDENSMEGSGQGRGLLGNLFGRGGGDSGRVSPALVGGRTSPGLSRGNKGEHQIDGSGHGSLPGGSTAQPRRGLLFRAAGIARSERNVASTATTHSFSASCNNFDHRAPSRGYDSDGDDASSLKRRKSFSVFRRGGGSAQDHSTSKTTTTIGSSNQSHNRANETDLKQISEQEEIC